MTAALFSSQMYRRKYTTHCRERPTMLASPGTVISWWYTAIQALASSQQDFHHNLGFLERLPELSKADFRKVILSHDGTQKNGRTFCRFSAVLLDKKTPGNVRFGFSIGETRSGTVEVECSCRYGTGKPCLRNFPNC